MTRTRSTFVVLLGIMAIVGLASVSAHEVTHRGTVQAVEMERVQVQTVTDAGEDAELVWFTVTADTKVQRGDAVVAYADAAVGEGERIVVLVNTDFDATEALELRLARR